MRRSLFTVYLTLFLDLLGLGIILPVLPFYAQSFGASGLLVGLTMAVYSAMQLVSAPILGSLSDRHGRRPVLLMSIAGSAISLAVTGFAGSLAVLLLGRALSGLFGGSIGPAQAYVADLTDPKDRAKYMGLVGSMTGLGFIFGPALGAALAPFGLGTAALVASALSVVNFVLAWMFLPESRSKSARKGGLSFAKMSQAIQHPSVGRLLMTGFLATFAVIGVHSTFPLFGEQHFGLNPGQLGILFTMVGLTGVIVQMGLIGRMTARFGERNTLIVGLAITAVTLFLMPLVGSFVAAVMIMCTQSLGNGFTNPTLASLISQESGDGERGALLGVSQSMQSLGRALSPIVAGFLYDQNNSLPYLIGGVVVLVGISFAMRLAPSHQSRPVVASAS